jgi:hypothetical protein
MLARALAAAACFALAAAALAGTPCTDATPTPETVRKALLLAKQAHDALEESGAEVALIARVGQDLSKYGLRYSHLGFVLRDRARGVWSVYHELNHCGTAESGLYREGLGNFFLDDMFAYETLVLVPGGDARRRLAEVLASDLPERLHGLPYNMVAYAFSTRYQNSNQWVLEVLAGALATEPRPQTREQAQAWLKSAGFRPITVEIDALTRLGARMFRANVAFDDHPFDRRMAGQIDTVTVESVIRFVEERDPQAKKLLRSLPQDGAPQPR